MKKLLTTTLTLVMVGAFCLAMSPAMAGDPPASSTIKSHGKKAAVKFVHTDAHKTGGCTACHASDAGGKIAELNGGADDKAAKKAGHAFCKKCHDGKKAFKTTKCKNCHK